MKRNISVLLLPKICSTFLLTFFKFQPRNKPVEFEKEPEEEDPYGLDAFLNTAKTGSGKRPLDKIGSKGHLHAGSAGSKDYQSQDRDSKRKKIDFEGSRSRR